MDKDTVPTGAWLGIVTLIGGIFTAFWSWVTGRGRYQADLDNTRTANMNRSFNAQKNMLEQVEQIARDMSALRAENRVCEETTDRLTRQNRQQAAQIAALQEEVASLRARIDCGPHDSNPNANGRHA